MVLHVKSNDRWSKELYDKTLRVIEKDAALDWMIRLDGPYGESSESIIDTEHAVLVGGGHGISRIAPILQDIALRLNNDSNKILLKRIDLHWIIEDHAYFEWFTKLLQDINDDSDMFNYHIYFVDKSPDSFNEKLMYIATNAVDKSTKVSLIDNLWDITNFGLPNWSDKLTDSRKKFSDLNCSVFYSGPRKYYNALKNSCRKLKIPIKKNSF